MTPSHNNGHNGNVRSFELHHGGPCTRIVKQEDMDIYLIAHRELEAAQEIFREAYTMIRCALLAGAIVEPGPHDAQLIPTYSTGRTVSRFKYLRLLVR